MHPHALTDTHRHTHRHTFTYIYKEPKIRGWVGRKIQMGRGSTQITVLGEFKGLSAIMYEDKLS